MKPTSRPSMEFSGESGLFLNSTDKNYIERSLHQSVNTSVLRYIITEPYIKNRHRPACLLSVTSPRRLLWDLFIMALAVWNCFYVPFSIAFLSTRESTLQIVFNVLIDSAYICDIGVYARSTYVDLYTGEEVWETDRIMWHYFKSGKLLIDVFSGIPFGIISWATGDNEQFRLITLVKVIRLLRLSKILMFMQTSKHIKLKLKLVQLFFVFLAYLHIIACLWFLLLCDQRQYIPPALYIDTEADLYESSGVRQYAYSIYMSVYMLTAAEIGPRTAEERIFAGFVIILGQLFLAFMFGEIAVVLLNLNQQSVKIATIQEAAATTMVNMRLKSSLRRAIAAYLVSSQAFMRKQAEFEEFFLGLNPSLKQEVISQLFAQTIGLNSVASQDTEVADQIITKLAYKYCQPEEAIIVQGEPAYSLFFISTGKCEVWVLDEYKQPHRGKHLTLGQHFGELALLYSRPRSASVLAASHVTLAQLSKGQFQLLLDKYPKARILFEEKAIKYNDHYQQFLKKTLRRCPFLKSLKRESLNRVIYRLPVERYEGQTYLYKEGDIVDKVVFILDGLIDIYVPFNDYKAVTLTSDVNWSRELSKQMDLGRESLANIKHTRGMRYLSKWHLASLSKGSVIGSNSILLQEPVNMYVKTAAPTVVMTLSVDLLQACCVEMPELGDAVRKYREVMQMDHWLMRVRRIQQSALDYEKCFGIGESDAYARRLKVFMKVKRCAMGKMLEKRNIKARGFPNMLSLSHKLKALIEAEQSQDTDMIEKLRLEAFPIASDFLAPALHLLHTSEVSNPVLIQFGIEASKCAGHIKATQIGLRSIQIGLEMMRCVRREVAGELGDMREFMSLMDRVRGLKQIIREYR